MNKRFILSNIDFNIEPKDIFESYNKTELIIYCDEVYSSLLNEDKYKINALAIDYATTNNEIKNMAIKINTEEYGTCIIEFFIKDIKINNSNTLEIIINELKTVNVDIIKI